MAGLPAGALMARAARALADHCTTLLTATGRRVAGAHVLALIGSGSNGGDALHAAAHLATAGARVDLLLLAGTADGEALDHARSAGAAVIPSEDQDRLHEWGRSADLLLDGIVGIGGRGPLREPAARAYQVIVAGARDGGGRMRTVAVDLPSGIDPDTGHVADPQRAVRADLTVTFGCLKAGLLVDPGASHCGTVAWVDIGLSTALLAEPPVLRVVTAGEAAPAFIPATPLSTKFRRGVVGILAGSVQYPGAAVLALGAARRAGAGMVRGHVPEELRLPLAVHYPDVVTTSGPLDDLLADRRITAWGCGPGLGLGAAATAAAACVLDLGVPTVVDADALTLLAAGRLRVHPRCLLTPHEGEAERLLPGVLREGRLAGLHRLIAAYGCPVLLKGHRTLIGAPGLPWAWVIDRAPAGLAIAGAGDVLTGLLAGLLAAHSADGRPTDPASLATVAAAAAFHHARAAAELTAHSGDRVTAADLVG